MITVSLMFHKVWTTVEPYLHVVEHGDKHDPQVRVEFLDLPEKLARALVTEEMPCVHCQRPIHMLRKREGDFWDRLYYAPTCELAKRIACSRGNAAMLEYERFVAYAMNRPVKPSSQMSLF